MRFLCVAHYGVALANVLDSIPYWTSSTRARERRCLLDDYFMPPLRRFLFFKSLASRRRPRCLHRPENASALARTTIPPLLSEGFGDLRATSVIGYIYPKFFAPRG
ncbi:hypothetical protein CONPUDRAFT_85404 [Coniophora puteana RWD-64-598 SS2]|uniref:Uncharacterized protein n=1 Tax=Coniophora puteana (strain RWD-64-598) TaxID=741705 RepID=A0A5M3MAE6_CONPW|nr:uncharacterized protein CONPUDRAFT_85404 [Coniophora puteana RWD-64-598 SS2]EIW75750.1 hypothetical protein CONPUDRAFT_85404 [Coniophora puteana RWD-64-598 SS2]